MTAVTTNPASILPPDTLAKIQDSLAKIKLGLAQTELATRAGLDVGTFETQLKAAQDKLLRIKNVYYPGQ